jgi:hypothetical protein
LEGGKAVKDKILKALLDGLLAQEESSDMRPYADVEIPTDAVLDGHFDLEQLAEFIAGRIQ